MYDVIAANEYRDEIRPLAFWGNKFTALLVYDVGKKKGGAGMFAMLGGGLDTNTGSSFKYNKVGQGQDRDCPY